MRLDRHSYNSSRLNVSIYKRVFPFQKSNICKDQQPNDPLQSTTKPPEQPDFT